MTCRVLLFLTPTKYESSSIATRENITDELILPILYQNITNEHQNITRENITDGVHSMK